MRLPAFITRLPVAIACTAALAAGLFIVSLPRLVGEASQRARLTALAAADDAAIATLLRSWATDDGELSFVVERLGDERGAVADAAGVVLHEQLTVWQTLRSENSSPKVASLARMLSESADGFSAAGHRAASALAQRMLLWPLDDGRVDVAAVYADCDAVLRASSSLSSDSLLAVGVDNSSGDGGMMIARRDATDAIAGDVESAAPLAGGGLPWEAAELPPQEQPPNAAPVVPAPADDERPFDAPGEIYAPLATPLELLDGKVRIDDKTASQRHGVGSLFRHTDAIQSGDVDGEKDSRPLRIDECDDWTLMRRLQQADEAPAAETELRARGFTPQTLALARQMTDPSARVRQELAEALPQTPGISPQAWLVQLARDSDPDVRGTAIAIIASSNDASVTRWLAELRDRERDARVAAAIDDLLRRR